MLIPILIVLLGLFVASRNASATEHGGTSYPSGGDDFLVAAMPPPGWYGIVYGNRYTDDDIGLRVNAIALRLDWVKPVTVFGADRWGTLLVLPLLDVATPGGSRRGAGDLTLGNGLHWTFDGYHALLAADIVFPTGRTDLGRDQFVVRLNHMGTWFPSGRWEISYRLHTDINFRNRHTGYRSGRTAYLDVAAGWKPTPATTIGIAGYVLRQLNDDELDGRRVGDGNRLSVRGIGPVVKHFFSNGAFVAASWYREPAANVWLYVGKNF
ncbi:MAG TPA: transporter [Usitatibacter sp.]|nr:transporter [Usitatibacter sp.]